MYAAEWPCCHDPLRFSLGSDDLSPQRGNPTRRTPKLPLPLRASRLAPSSGSAPGARCDAAARAAREGLCVMRTATTPSLRPLDRCAFNLSLTRARHHTTHARGLHPIPRLFTQKPSATHSYQDAYPMPRIFSQTSRNTATRTPTPCRAFSPNLQHSTLLTGLNRAVFQRVALRF